MANCELSINSPSKYIENHVEMPPSKTKPFIVPIFIPHSGCPHQCVFCNQRAITSTAAKLPSDSDIYTRISQFLEYKRPSRSHVEVSFYGGNFLGLPEEHILRLLNVGSSFADSGKIHAIRLDENKVTTNQAAAGNNLDRLVDDPVCRFRS